MSDVESDEKLEDLLREFDLIKALSYLAVSQFGNDTKSSRGRRNAGRAEYNGGIARFDC